MEESKTKNLSDGIHEMLAGYNAKRSKVFYYSEEEVRRLCYEAFSLAEPEVSDTFEDWWNNAKKK